MLYDIAIVGGGATGLATAIFAARERPGTRIGIVDGACSLGAKILISGGGRCNVTNRVVDARDFNGGTSRAIATVLRALPVQDTVAFFAALSVGLHEEARGKLFPDSNRARSVLDALLAETIARTVEIRAATRVHALHREADGFQLETSAGLIRTRAVVLATGGRSLPRTGSDGLGYVIACSLGHTLVPTTPGLVPLLIDDDLHEGLAGISLDVRLELAAPAAPRRTFEGPLLWTHHGVSGPAVLDASRHVLRHRLERREPLLTASLLPRNRDDASKGPGDGADESHGLDEFTWAENWILDTTRTRPAIAVSTLLAERLPAALAARLAHIAGADHHTLATLPREVRRRVVHALLTLPLRVRESRGYDHAEVTAGGITLNEIDPRTMQSRICPGLFLAGEILDVDGRLGGFNFQWAWSSARVAASGLRAFLAG